MRIARLTLATKDLEGQADFWGGRIGLPVGRVGEEEVEVRLHDSTIAFRRADPGLDARYHFAISVPADSIYAALDWLRERHEVLAFHDDPEADRDRRGRRRRGRSGRHLRGAARVLRRGRPLGRRPGVRPHGGRRPPRGRDRRPGRPRLDPRRPSGAAAADRDRRLRRRGPRAHAPRGPVRAADRRLGRPHRREKRNRAGAQRP